MDARSVTLTPEQAHQYEQFRACVVSGEKESSFLTGDHWVVPDKWLLASKATIVELRVPYEHEDYGVGTVAVARATVTLLPVTDVWPEGANHNRAVTAVARGGVLYIEGLDPPPVAGRDYVAVFEDAP